MNRVEEAIFVPFLVFLLKLFGIAKNVEATFLKLSREPSRTRKYRSNVTEHTSHSEGMRYS